MNQICLLFKKYLQTRKKWSFAMTTFFWSLDPAVRVWQAQEQKQLSIIFNWSLKSVFVQSTLWIHFLEGVSKIRNLFCTCRGGWTKHLNIYTCLGPGWPKISISWQRQNPLAQNIYLMLARMACVAKSEAQKVFSGVSLSSKFLFIKNRKYCQNCHCCECYTRGSM